MSRSSWIILPLFAIILLTTLQTAEGVKCYVCSWSPENVNSTNICMNANFTNSLRIHTCVQGCESGSVYDKNGRLEFFYRNCAQSDTVITGTCNNITSKAVTKQICTCNSNYCNSGLNVQQVGAVISFALAFLVMLI